MNDLISRQAAITEFNCCELTPDGGIDANYAIEFLEMLPSAQPNVHDFPKDADCISRQQAIDAVLGVIPDDDYWKEQVKKAVFALPSAQPDACENTCEIERKSNDMISRQDAVSREAVSEWLKQYGQDVLHGKYKFSLMYIWKNLMDLPSVQPEKFEWCHDCKEYDQTQHYCPRWTKVIRRTVEELKAQSKTGKWIYDGDCYICNKCKSAFNWWADSQTSNYCPNCGARMKEGD